MFLDANVHVSVKLKLKLCLIGSQTAFTGCFTELIKNRQVAKRKKENKTSVALTFTVSRSEPFPQLADDSSLRIIESLV